MRGVGALTRAALTFAILAACNREPKFEGVAIDPPRPMPNFEFVRSDSTRVALAPEAGRPLVLFFGYTHCPDVCPTTLADWTRVKSKLGAKAERVRFVFVTVDPDRDTPDVAQRYARQYDSTFVGVSGDGPTTAAITSAYGVASAKEDQQTAAGYLVSHSSQVFLVNDAGALVALYPFGTRWESLAADLEQLLDRKP
ncbi:MAG: SCO family protein [Gemmatimonadaceae bacterium]|nr:SCO family protein [Gemmatimonadaceae bacterium]